MWWLMIYCSPFFFIFYFLTKSWKLAWVKTVPALFCICIAVNENIFMERFPFYLHGKKICCGRLVVVVVLWGFFFFFVTYEQNIPIMSRTVRQVTQQYCLPEKKSSSGLWMYASTGISKRAHRVQVEHEKLTSHKASRIRPQNQLK